jgi:hypothetical protein
MDWRRVGGQPPGTDAQARIANPKYSQLLGLKQSALNATRDGRNANPPHERFWGSGVISSRCQPARWLRQDIRRPELLSIRRPTAHRSALRSSPGAWQHRTPPQPTSPPLTTPSCGISGATFSSYERERELIPTPRRNLLCSPSRNRR